MQVQAAVIKPEPKSPTSPETVNKQDIQIQPEPKEVTSFLIVHGNLFRCSVTDLKNIAYSIVKDDKYELVEKAFNCQFRISQRGKNSELHVDALPLKGCLGPSSKFLQQWAIKVLEGEPVEMSSYWMDFCRKSTPLS